MRWPPGATAARSAAVAAILILAGCGYVGLLWHFGAAETAVERQIGAVAPEQALLQIYLETLSIDALNQNMQVRVSLTPGPSLRGKLATAPDRDLVLVVSHGKTIQELRLPADQLIAPAVLEVALRKGKVVSYPLDRYEADLGIRCFERSSSSGSPAALPASVTVWEALLGFRLETSARPADNTGEIHLEFEVRRSGAFIVFALAAYGAMIVLGCCALAVGILVFFGAKRAEATLIGALGAIVFTLPALRNILPGAPPLGVRADLLVFLWTELAAAIALALLVVSWSRAEPR
jgi:hypothetical protein